MSNNKRQKVLEMMEALSNLLSEAAQTVRQLPIELFPGDIEQSLTTHLTSLLRELNKRGVAPDVEKDKITVQGEVRAVHDTISDVLTLVVDQGDQKGLLDPARRDELVKVILEQSEIVLLVNRGSIRKSQIELWVARQLAQMKGS